MGTFRIALLGALALGLFLAPASAAADDRGQGLKIDSAYAIPGDVGAGGSFLLNLSVRGIPSSDAGQIMTVTVQLSPGGTSLNALPVKLTGSPTMLVQEQLDVPANLAARHYEGHVQVAVQDLSSSQVFRLWVFSAGPPGELPEVPYPVVLPLLLLAVLPLARRLQQRHGA